MHKAKQPVDVTCTAQAAINSFPEVTACGADCITREGQFLGGLSTNKTLLEAQMKEYNIAQVYGLIIPIITNDPFYNTLPI